MMYTVAFLSAVK